MSERIVEVTNRNSGFVGYTIKDQGIWRNFAPGETKKISLSELEALQFTPGGAYTLKNSLMIKDMDALSALNIVTEPEYFYTDKEIKELLTTGTLDQLKDCLDFAPEGVIDIIKKMAVEMELPDTQKRKAIYEKTGFSIDNAIMVNKVMEDTSDEKEDEKEVKVRRSAPVTVQDAAPSRRVELPRYNIVSK